MCLTDKLSRNRHIVNGVWQDILNKQLINENIKKMNTAAYFTDRVKSNQTHKNTEIN